MKRLLVAGFGDIARRAAPELERAFRVDKLSRRVGRDLDQPESLKIEGADALLHCAPPPTRGDTDTRTENLLAALTKASILPSRVVYVSTSGVYGDCRGELVDESRSLAPRTPRARRRVDAEGQLAAWCSACGAKLIVLRAPGIYAADRLPLERLRAGRPVLREEDDVYTSHIHADDLAAIVCRVLQDNAPEGVYNACDDTRMKMGDWLDLVADAAGLTRPPRVARAAFAEANDFMSESRRLDNTRLKQGLGIKLRYSTVHEGLAHAQPARID